MIDWKYPSEDPIPKDRPLVVYIDDEFEIVLVTYVGEKFFFIDRQGRCFAEKHITAWAEFNMPEPPEKPQDCPRCGKRGFLRTMLGRGYRIQCNTMDHCLQGPLADEKKEAVLLWNCMRWGEP